MKNKKISIFWFVLLVFFAILGAFLIPSIAFRQDDVYISMTGDFIGVAKSMLRGKILYSDVADHKGFYIFVPYLIAQSINMTSTVPVYVMEQFVFIIIVFSAFAFYKNQAKNVNSALKRTLFFEIIFVCYVFRRATVLASEGFLCIAIFCLFRYINQLTENEKKIKDFDCLLLGVVIGFFLFHKYTIILYFVPFLAILLAEMIRNKASIKRLLFSLLEGIFGVLISSIIPLGYCIVNHNFADMVEAMRGCMGDTKMYMIVSLVLGVLFSIFAFVNQINGRYAKRNFCILLSTFALNYVTLGNQQYLLLPYIIIMFCIMYREHGEKAKILVKITVIITVIYTILQFLSTLGHVVTADPRIPTAKSFYDHYHITNNDVLYLTEDCGYGIWSDEPYRIKYQWIPSRFFASEKGNELLKRNLELIKNRDFEFVVFYLPKEEENKEEMGELDKEYYKICGQIQEELDENYYRINRFDCVYRDKAYMGK